MAKRRYKPEEILRLLREIEIHQAQGLTVAESCKKASITEQTYYRWRKEYGGLDLSQLRRLKDLEKENARLKKIVADQAIDNLILKEAAEGNF